MNFVLPEAVKKAMHIMKSNGFESFIVGGSVRDFLMGKEPADFDITTNATPEQTKNCFSGFRVIETGIKHGTVTVLISDEPIEITTYRIDGKYLDNRHPESVEFTVNLEDDLSRRDFTVNALAYDGEEKIVDLFSGHKDLKNKIIRCVGEPDKRFSEDGLRILRALRFASVLDFSIDERTEVSIRKNKELLKNISTERILVELTKLICGVNAKKILLSYREVFECIIPEIKSFSHYEENIEALSKVENKKELRLAAFFSELENVGKTLKALKLDNKTKKLVTSLVSDLCADIKADRVFIKKMLILRDFRELEAVVCLKQAFGEDEGICQKIREIISSVKENGECVRIGELDISGNDIISSGIGKGRQIGVILNVLLDKVIEGGVENKKERLLEVAEKISEKF